MRSSLALPRIVRGALGALVLPAVAARCLSAQERSPDTARVQPVVVTATRVPLERGALPVAVTVITAEQLRIRGITTVADALNDVTSASVAQAGSQGATTSLFLRGGESKYVKVLVDGVPANDPGGSFDFASLTTDNVERIEIVRGPASVIHGADAVTGVVHIITRQGTGAPRGEAAIRIGSAPRHAGPSSADPAASRLLDASAAFSGAASAVSWSMSLSRHESTGLYATNNRYQNNVLSGRVELTPLEHTDIRLRLRVNDYQYNYPTDGGGNVVDANAHRTEDRTLVGLEVERRLSPVARALLTVNSSVNEGGTDDRADTPTGNSFVSQDKIRRRGAELRLHVTPRFGAFTVGAQLERQDQRSQSQSESSFGLFASNFRAARRNAGVYAEAVLQPAASLVATLGGRVDDNEQFGRFGTGRAGLSWHPVAGTRVRATIGNAFREPSFQENYASGFVTGNPGLEPERTTSWDGGIDQQLFADRVELSLTGFAQRFVNMIDYEPSATACGYSYCNVAEATSNGIEADVRSRVWGPWWAGAGATFLKTRVVEPGFDASSGGLYRRGESLIRRPERKVTADLSYRGAARLTAMARLLAVGVRTDRDFRTFPSTPVTLPSYERLDLGAEYHLPDRRNRYTISLRVENATDRTYENVFNFLTPRRTISLGVRSTF